MLNRLLELVRRELEADDARVELGGRDPEDPRMLWVPLPNGWRLVACFSSEPAERTEKTERLLAFAETFSTTAELEPHPRSEHGSTLRGLAIRRLDTELHALATRAGAVEALVIDEASPVIWGTSEPRHDESSVEAALETAALERLAQKAGVDAAEVLVVAPNGIRDALNASGAPAELARELEHGMLVERQRYGQRSIASWRRHLLTARAIAHVRRDELAEARRGGHVHEVLREEGFGYLARSFATIYVLVLVFDGALSELHAETAVRHALPVVERLVLALPPIDPRPAGRALRLLR
jgi:hypothetical protein